MKYDLIPPLSTSEGRKYAEALPKLGAAEQGKFIAVGFPEEHILYRWHHNVDVKTGEDKSNWAYVYSNNWFTRNLSAAIERKG